MPTFKKTDRFMKQFDLGKNKNNLISNHRRNELLFNKFKMSIIGHKNDNKKRKLKKRFNCLPP